MASSTRRPLIASSIAVALALAFAAAVMLRPAPRAPRLEVRGLNDVPLFAGPPVQDRDGNIPPAIFTVPNHSRVTVVARTAYHRQVTITEGESKGRTGWVFDRWVSEK